MEMLRSRHSSGASHQHSTAVGVVRCRNPFLLVSIQAEQLRDALNVIFSMHQEERGALCGVM